jgi:hypothetical protein
MLNQDVLLDFFLTFARCEFALKIGGFAKGGGKRGVGMEAQANWDAFAHALPTDFQSSIGPEVEGACERLIDTPPWELVLINRDVMWQQQARPAAGNLAVDALTAVRRLRNNLFHGNEASAVHGFVTSHIEQRLRDAVLVLRATVSLLPTVQAAYNSAAL